MAAILRETKRQIKREMFYHILSIRIKAEHKLVLIYITFSSVFVLIKKAQFGISLMQQSTYA